MDAKLRRAGLLGVTFATLIGCDAMLIKPSVRPRHSNPPEPKPHSEVVKAEVPSTGGEAEPVADTELVSQTVLGYIQRIDDIERRAGRSAEEATDDASGAGRPSPAQGLVEQPARAPGQIDGSDETAHGATRRMGEASTAPGGAPDGAAADDPQRSTEARTGMPGASLPPMLVGVSARGRESVSKVEPESPTAVPGVNAPAAAQQAPTSLLDFLHRWPGDESTSAFRRQLDTRVLRVLAGEYEKAREPLNLVSTEQQEMAARAIESLIAIREAHDGDPAGAARRVMAELERLREVLKPLSELRVPTVAICRDVTGYGQYNVIEPPRFRAGITSEFVVYCEVQDFVSHKRDDGLFETRFDLRTRVLSSAGETVLDLRDDEVVDRCRQPRVDCFISRLVRLPAALAPGEYVVKVTIVDKLGEKTAENRATIRLLAGP